MQTLSKQKLNRIVEAVRSDGYVLKCKFYDEYLDSPVLHFTDQTTAAEMEQFIDSCYQNTEHKDYYEQRMLDRQYNFHIHYDDVEVGIFAPGGAEELTCVTVVTWITAIKVYDENEKIKATDGDWNPHDEADFPDFEAVRKGFAQIIHKHASGNALDAEYHIDAT